MKLILKNICRVYNNNYAYVLARCNVIEERVAIALGARYMPSVGLRCRKPVHCRRPAPSRKYRIRERKMRTHAYERPPARPALHSYNATLLRATNCERYKSTRFYLHPTPQRTKIIHKSQMDEKKSFVKFNLH